MPADVPSFIRTYGAREFFSKSTQNQNKLLYDKFPLEKKSTLRMAKKRFVRHEHEQKRSPHVNKKKTVTPSVKSSPPTDQFSSLKSPPAASVHAEVATSLKEMDLSSLDANQQTLFKIAWAQYVMNPSPQWFNVLMSFLKETNQLKSQETEEWQQLKQLDNNKLISLIKPERYSLPDTSLPHLKNSAKPSN